MKKLFLTLFIFILITGPAALAQKKSLAIERCDPPCWWTGMNNPRLDLLIRGQNIQDYSVKLNNKHIKLDTVIRPDNTNYLILRLNISPLAAAEKFDITFIKGKQTLPYAYELRDRKSGANSHQGLNSTNLIYLLMPDRFSNGDTLNDHIAGMQDSLFCRDSLFSRHGGDLQGIIKHLDYFTDLGVTALWLTPVFETNQPLASYHGYAVTDHYQIDPRLGNNKLYADFVRKCHKSGIKVVMDMVFNHIGDQSWMYCDLPSQQWIHRFKTYTKTNYRDVTLMDPYASSADKTTFSDGWFDKHMPDLNQQDELLATYLIQNTLWWIEYAGIDGIRIDTYTYPDQHFMSQWTKAVLEEYPELGIFGETWVSGLANQAYYTKNSGLKNNFDPQLPGVTDFQLFYAINNALTKDFGWTDGVAAIYYCLANDFLYQEPQRNVIFLDNHDQNRFFSVIGEDLEKFKMGIGLLLTMRGIPSVYYGTEILMKNFGPPDEKLRMDFPGGWPQDSASKFSSTGRNKIENEAFNYFRKLAVYRKENPALQNGKLMQFVPVNGIYVYFRYDDIKTIMVIVNQNNEKKIVETSRFAEIVKDYTKARNIMTDALLDRTDRIEAAPKSTTILELHK